VAATAPWKGRVTFHGRLPDAAYAALIQRCHVGLNCQRASHPISSVTFPSKIFSYLSAGLVVVSSRASEVPAVCGDACLYYEAEEAASLAAAVRRALSEYPEWVRRLGGHPRLREYTPEGTARRVREMVAAARLV
jgi:glycosyltransferase involved in cell wall biosynthesis